MNDNARQNPGVLAMKTYARLKRMILADDSDAAEDELKRILESDGCTVRDRKLCAILFLISGKTEVFDCIKKDIDTAMPFYVERNQWLEKLWDGYDILHSIGNTVERDPHAGIVNVKDVIAWKLLSVALMIVVGLIVLKVVRMICAGF